MTRTESRAYNYCADSMQRFVAMPIEVVYFISKENNAKVSRIFVRLFSKEAFSQELLER
jgi:hypothetical protein